MEIKVIETTDGIPMINNQICGLNEIVDVGDAKEDIKHYSNQGVKILIKQDNEFVTTDEYFSENDDKDVDENVNNDEINYDDIFVNVDHWTEKAENVKQYDDVETVEKLLDYAEENESDGVVKRIRKYLDELKE